MTMDYVLLIYPILIFAVLLAGCTVEGRGRYNEEAWDISQSKAMQAFAALMIILHHTVQTITSYGNTYRGPITEWSSFGILFTAIFFFFSGFGLYKSYKGKEGYLHGFLDRRLPRILIPFLLTNLFFLIAFRSRITELRYVFTSILGLTLLNPNTWFIVELAILYIVFYLAFGKSKTEGAALRRISLFTLAMAMFSLLLGHDYSDINGHWFMGEWWYNTVLIFVMGLFGAKYEDRIKAFARKYYRAVLPAALIILVIWYRLAEYVRLTFGYWSETENHPGYPEKFFTFVMQTILCALFVYVLLLINMKIRFGNRVLTFLGGISLEIYLIHDWLNQMFQGLPDILYIGLTIGLSIIPAWLLSKADKTLIGLIQTKPKAVKVIQAFYIAVFVGMLVTEGIAVFGH